MIPKRPTYTRQQVEQLLRYQHIATLAACSTPLAQTFDNGEKVYVGEVLSTLAKVQFDSIRIDESAHKYPLTD